MARAKRGGRQRDYAAEYARRVASGAAQGFSRSQSRGHPAQADEGLSISALKQMRRAVEADTAARREYGPSGALRGAYRRETARDALARLAGVRVPTDWRDGTRRSGAAARFVEQFLRLHLGTEHEAYTLWFSP